MKKIFIVIISLIPLLSISQVLLKKLDGTVINNGDVFVFNKLTEPANYLGLKIFNSSSQEIKVKIKVVSIQNSDAANIQLCMDVCYAQIIVGNSYPNNGLIIPANGQNGNFDHFLNTNPGIVTGQNVNYVFKLYIVDSNNVEVGNSITFTYRYNSSLATSEFDKLSSIGVKLKSTLVENCLDFTSTEAVATDIFDLTGKRVVFNKITNAGNQSIDISNLSTNTYIAQFTTLDGKNATAKFIKN